MAMKSLWRILPVLLLLLCHHRRRGHPRRVDSGTGSGARVSDRVGVVVRGRRGPSGSEATVAAHGGVANAIGHGGGGVEGGCGFLMMADQWVLMVSMGVDGCCWVLMGCGWVRVLMVAFVLMFVVVGVDVKKWLNK